ncbi:MAG TPA: tetratricopeptide repeat protein [Rudaea sp.]|nr:tetratricopeptide repeat protein [Rudaea sp.]
MSLLAELRRRNVYRAAVLYAASAWLLVQVATQVFPFFHIAEWVVRWIVVAAVIGFPFALLFAWFYEWTPQGIQRESEVAPEASITRQTGRKLDRLIFVVMGVAIVLLLTDRFVLRKDAPAISDNSIAVLPLTNESGDKDQQFFSDGLSENFIVALSQFSGLKVIGRNSSFQFRDAKDDSKSIGQKLGVATLLEGSVQRAGDAVRISAELIRAADGSTMWTQRYDRPYKDLFALQDDITQSVAAALKTKLLANDTAATQTDRPPSGNLDAYSAYLQGKFYFARSSEADWRKALEHYATATQIDPRYALAWVGSSHARAWLAAQYLGGAEAERLNTQARSDLDTALKLEPNLAAARMVRGEVLTLDFDWSGAEAEFRRALQFEPNNSDALENLGVLFGTLGHPEQAIPLVQRSLITDPLRPGGFLLLARYLASQDHLDEAEQSIRKAIALQPVAGIFDATLAVIEVQRGDAQAALAEAERTLPGNWQDYALAMAQQIGNDRAAADAALRQVIDKDADGMAFQIAQVQALRGDPDQAFAWLDHAFANRDPGLQFLLVDRFLLRYQGDPRFAAFCKKMGLPATTTAKALP